MENKGESPKIENSGEQNVSDSAKKWESVKEVEFAGNDSARDKFYERYYKDHQEEIHKLVQDFLDQKMAEEEEHHAEEMTRIVETQTDGWTEEDSRKLHETSEKTEEKVEEKTEEKAEEPEKAEEAKEESAEQIVARMFEETHQDKAAETPAEEVPAEETSAEDTPAEEPKAEETSPEEETEEETEDEITEFIETPAEEPKAETEEPKAEAEEPKAEESESDFGEHGETRFRVGENNDDVKEETVITTPEGDELALKVDKSQPVNPEKYLVYSLSDSEQEAIPRDKLVEVYQSKVENATDAKKYFETARLSNQIMHEYQDNPEIIAQLKAIESTPIYQKNRTNAELETAKKIMAKRSEDLIHAQEEYDKLNKGGMFKKLMNRMARKTAKSRLEWTQKDITNAQNDIARLEAQLAQFGGAEAPAAEAAQAAPAEAQAPVAEAPVTEASEQHPNVVNFEEKAAEKNKRFINEPVTSAGTYQNKPVGNKLGQYAGDDREENAA